MVKKNKKKFERKSSGPAVPEIRNKRRMTGVLLAFACLFLFILGRLGYVVIAQGPELQKKAEGQWTRNLSVSAKRGSIFDRNGNLLAQSANSDTVVLRIGKVIDAEKVGELMSQIIDMQAQDIVASIQKAKQGNKSEIWLKRQISNEQAQKIIETQRDLTSKGKTLSKEDNAKLEKLDCIYLTLDTKRYYPNKDFLTQVLGYTTIDGEGQEGLEAKYDKYMRGQQGRVVAQTDRDGKEIPFTDELFIPAKDGYNLVLTIDEILQSFLEKAVTEAYMNADAKSALGICVDPMTGGILACVNVPDFDLNAPPRSDIKTLQELSRNRTIVDVYEPGSTFKIITTAAALDTGAATMESTYNCAGFRIIDGQRIKCWRSSHGHQVLTEAVMNSCNPAFMDMAVAMGKDTFYEYINNFGFGQPTKVDYSADGAGLVMDPKYVKNMDLARIGFGQSIAVTPLQLVIGASATINGGNLYKPYFVSALTDNQGNVVEKYEPTLVRRVISEENSYLMQEILENVVKGGSGRNAGIEGYRIGGKTGTAQKFENGKIATGKVVSSFVGFAPTNDPKLLVLIAVDEPSSGVQFGSVIAAPYVKMFFEDALKYLNVQPVYTEPQAPKIEVPQLIGTTLEEAKQILDDLGLPYMDDGTGNIVNQMPAAKMMVDKNTMVLLYTQFKDEADQSNGLIRVPDLKGNSILQCSDILKASGLKMEIIGSGLAVEQDPKPDELVMAGSTVKVLFERPPD